MCWRIKEWLFMSPQQCRTLQYAYKEWTKLLQNSSHWLRHIYMSFGSLKTSQRDIYIYVVRRIRVNFYQSGIWIVRVMSKYLICCTLSNYLVRIFILWCVHPDLETWTYTYLAFLALPSRPVSSLGTNKSSVFSFVVCMSSSSILTSLVYTRNWYVPLNI